MSDTQLLLSKIAAVRERLEKAQGQGPQPADLEISTTPLLSALVAAVPALDEPERVRALQESVSRAARHGALLDGCLRRLSGSAEMSAPPPRLSHSRVSGPHTLVGRAHRLLERGRQLLTQLRNLDAELGSTEEHFLEGLDPLADWHRDTVAMVDVALHIVQAFPEAPSDQIRLCEGLEVVLAGVSQRVAILTQAMQKRRLERAQVDTLADLLTCLEAGRPVDLKPFMQVAEAILMEARQASPLRFPEPFFPTPVRSQESGVRGQESGVRDQESGVRDQKSGMMSQGSAISDPCPLTPDSCSLDTDHWTADPYWVAHFVAGHSIIVAQVIARIIQPPGETSRRLQGWRGSLVEPVLAALIHDVGMLRVPAAILVQPGPLTIEQKRIVEDHTRCGGELAARLSASAAWLVEAARDHHERLDGTGYPAGKKDGSIGSLTRLLALCDVYGAMTAPRPYRPARETRTALTDTLLLAEQGALDRDQAERLLQLSFYPVGSIVELADGAVGLVVAGPNHQPDLNSPARPVIALLTDSRGQSLPGPQHLDLSCCSGRSIVRSLSTGERRQILGKHHPELVE